MRLSVGVLGASRRILASPDFREDFLEGVAPESELSRKGEWKNIKQWEHHEPKHGCLSSHDMYSWTQCFKVQNVGPPAPESPPDTLGSLIWLPQGFWELQGPCLAHCWGEDGCVPTGFLRARGLTFSSFVSHA